MTYQGLFDLGHLCVAILCITFYEIVLQYLNSEISKLHSLDRVFSTVYVIVLEQLLVPKILCFCSLPQTPTFQIISFLEVGHPTL